MARYIEVMTEVYDFDVLHKKEEWILVTDFTHVCIKCDAIFRSNTSLAFHRQLAHVPTGYEFLSFVDEFFSLQA